VKAAKGAQVAPGATELKIPNPVELSTAFSQIAKTLEPSVVNISTKYFAKTTSRGRTPQRRQASPFGEDQGDSDNGGGMEEFFRFFGNPFGQGIPRQRSAWVRSSGGQSRLHPDQQPRCGQGGPD
jgi:S1-C subfamily serine protease